MIMAILRAKDARTMAPDELREKKQQINAELSKEMGAVSSGTKAENPGKIREMKRTIARIKTIMHERGVNE